jgi:hypothetical protein
MWNVERRISGGVGNSAFAIRHCAGVRKKIDQSEMIDSLLWDLKFSDSSDRRLDYFPETPLAAAPRRMAVARRPPTPPRLASFTFVQQTASPCKSLVM